MQMLRTIMISAATAAMLALTAAPVLAGPAETAFLQKLTANWTGKGKLTGAQSGQVLCRLVITGGSQNVKYQGRCTIPDMAARAFSGSITYNDKLGRYESRTMGGTVAGIKRGNSLVFTDKSTSMEGTSYSQMTISPSSLVMSFTLIDKKGEKTTSAITFTKS
jgi:hypothetical protein